MKDQDVVAAASSHRASPAEQATRTFREHFIPVLNGATRVLAFADCQCVKGPGLVFPGAQHQVGIKAWPHGEAVCSI